MSSEKYVLLPIIVAGALTAAETFTVPIPFPGEVEEVASVLGTGNTGADLLVNLIVNGTEVWANTADKITHTAGVAAGTVVTKYIAPPVTPGTNYNTTAIYPTAAPLASFAAGAQVGVKIDQVGSTVAGSDLHVSLLVRKV